VGADIVMESIAQLCAFRSPFWGILSAIAILRQRCHCSLHIVFVVYRLACIVELL